MADKYEDLVPGAVWDGHVCTVDDAVTGQPKLVAIEEPIERHQHITTTELSERPELVWDQENGVFLYPGAGALELTVEDTDGQEN